MMMIRRRDGYRVDLVVHVSEHLAVVAEESGVGILLPRLAHFFQAALQVGKLGRINHVDQRDDLESGFLGAGDIGCSLASGTDSGQGRFFEFLVGQGGKEMKTCDRAGRGCGGFGERASCQSAGSGRIWHSVPRRVGDVESRKTTRLYLPPPRSLGVTPWRGEAKRFADGIQQGGRAEGEASEKAGF